MYISCILLCIYIHIYIYICIYIYISMLKPFNDMLDKKQF